MQNARNKSSQVGGTGSFLGEEWQVLTLVSDLLISLFGERQCSRGAGLVGTVLASQT